MPFYVLFISVCNLLISGTCIFQSRKLMKMRRLLHQGYDIMSSQHLIINAMLSRGIEVSCDYCGNPMAPNVPITVVEQEDGSVWVQHSSHGVG